MPLVYSPVVVDFLDKLLKAHFYQEPAKAASNRFLSKRIIINVPKDIFDKALNVHSGSAIYIQLIDGNETIKG